MKHLPLDRIRVIDKVDVRIPAETRFHPESRLYTELRFDPKKDTFHYTRHYTAVGDLRPYGYNAILHIGCKWGKAGNHKLELLDTGKRSFSGLVNDFERIFQIDGLRAEVMRRDLAIDVTGIPVSWFQSRLKANYEQFIANFGSAEFMRWERGGIQTLYFGKRPNLYRIYDKVAEYKSQYAKLIREKEEGVPPSLEEFCGMKETDVVTRVERQMGRQDFGGVRNGRAAPYTCYLRPVRQSEDYCGRYI